MSSHPVQTLLGAQSRESFQKGHRAADTHVEVAEISQEAADEATNEGESARGAKVSCMTRVSFVGNTGGVFYLRFMTEGGPSTCWEQRSDFMNAPGRHMYVGHEDPSRKRNHQFSRTAALANSSSECLTKNPQVCIPLSLC